MESLKQIHGVNNCYCLKINSRLPTSGQANLPDPWAQFLTRRGIPTIEKNSPKTPVETAAGMMPSRVNEDVNTPTSLQLEVGQEANETSSHSMMFIFD